MKKFLYAMIDLSEVFLKDAVSTDNIMKERDSYNASIIQKKSVCRTGKIP